MRRKTQGETTVGQYDVAKYHPNLIADIRQEVAEHQRTLVPGEDQLAR